MPGVEIVYVPDALRGNPGRAEGVGGDGADEERRHPGQEWRLAEHYAAGNAEDECDDRNEGDDDARAVAVYASARGALSRTYASIPTSAPTMSLIAAQRRTCRSIRTGRRTRERRACGRPAGSRPWNLLTASASPGLQGRARIESSVPSDRCRT